MKKAYIILTYPDSIPSRIIRLYTKEPYSHVSFTFDETLDEFYSFGRKGLYNIFNAGFIREHIEMGVIGRRDTSCRICCVDITDEQYRKMQNTLQMFFEHAKEYHYNFAGFFAAGINKAPKYDNRFFCSQFVAYVLEKGGVDIFGKSYLQIKPKDFTDCKNLQIVYEGGINEYPLRRKHAKAG